MKILITPVEMQLILIALDQDITNNPAPYDQDMRLSLLHRLIAFKHAAGTDGSFEIAQVIPDILDRSWKGKK